MFHIGQKVMCVDADGEPELVKDRIYVVTRNNYMPKWISVDCCQLHAQMDGAGWAAYRFRPIVERRTDISVFTKMLHATKHRKPV